MLNAVLCLLAGGRRALFLQCADFLISFVQLDSILCDATLLCAIQDEAS